MGKKKSDEGATKAKQGGKEKLSVSALLASMDAKPDKPKKAASKDDVLDSEEEQKQNDIQKKQGRQNRSAARLDITVSDKELKKREKKDFFATQAAAELAKQEALKDDRDAFTVELLKNASVKISHGKRYGLVGPNGMGKSTLLKLLAWRKIPVPKNIDVLLVEQEVVGDDRSAIEAVVSANEELIKLRQEVAALQDSSAVSTGENGDDDEGDDVGEKLSELYEKLQLMGSDAAEAQASKILAGLGFTKDMQGRPTKSFSGGWRMRISLARALFVQPTLLLLDEPTNHLDLRAVLWLEEYLY
ncbi:UNVERIFIED_CONTAM: ABC transporter F family member 4 [Sesamum latifolium]|uniref:ABC transporter F family member 4 n=1 Tax=Sesamum latifolium TaxID=2727402 RepID=A0AAW2Y7W5_9LAMI